MSHLFQTVKLNERPDRFIHEILDVHHLALETSTATGSLAAFDGGELLVQVDLDPAHGTAQPGQRSAKSLAPALARLLKDLAWRATDLQLISVTVGPGSFTGLRIGVTTAKTLAYVAAAEVIGINTLEAIAWPVAENGTNLSVVMDAFRGQLFTKTFTREPDGQLCSLDKTRIVDRADWLESLAASPGQSIAGPNLAKLRDHLPTGTEPVDEPFWFPSASNVGHLAWSRYQAERLDTSKETSENADDLWSLLPKYYRKSAAEEKRELH